MRCGTQGWNHGFSDREEQMAYSVWHKQEVHPIMLIVSAISHTP
jgi:hypothetical protein